MATTTANFDINVLADLAVGALAQKLDQIAMFSLGVEMGALNQGDTAKVFVHSKNVASARNFDESSNNYLTDNGAYTITGVNVPLDNHIYDNAIFSQSELNRVDMERVAKGLAHNVARNFTLRLYDNLITAANFATVSANSVIGAAGSFTHDNLALLETDADDQGFLEDERWAVLLNTYTANMKIDGVLVANRNQPSTPEIVSQRFQEIHGFNTMGSSVMKQSTNVGGEDLAGFITDGTGIGIGLGLPDFTGAGTGVAEVAQATDDKSGLPLQIRKVYDQATGKWSINAELLMGYSVLDGGGLIRLTSA